jgi:hypothetical protein
MCTAFDDISSEEHFENSKINRGPYFNVEPFVFGPHIEFYLVTQFIQIVYVR